MACSHFSTEVSDGEAATVGDLALAAWNGQGTLGLMVGSCDGAGPALINLARVELIRMEEIPD